MPGKVLYVLTKWDEVCEEFYSIGYTFNMGVAERWVLKDGNNSYLPLEEYIENEPKR